MLHEIVILCLIKLSGAGRGALSEIEPKLGRGAYAKGGGGAYAGEYGMKNVSDLNISNAKV